MELYKDIVEMCLGGSLRLQNIYLFIGVLPGCLSFRMCDMHVFWTVSTFCHNH